MRSWNSNRRILDSAIGCMVKQHWGYDALSRKSDIAITMPGVTDAPTGIDLEYDPAGRLAKEKLLGGGAQRWDLEYGYDNAENRTSKKVAIGGGSPVTKTFGYGPGNRESTINGSTTGALQYDFKGNVTVRPPLEGGASYEYAWDINNRLRSAARTGQTTVYFDYDAGWRQLRRREGTGSTAKTTYTYWLGLNKLAEEEVVGDGSSYYWRPNAEAGGTPAAGGWKSFGGA